MAKGVGRRVREEVGISFETVCQTKPSVSRIDLGLNWRILMQHRVRIAMSYLCWYPLTLAPYTLHLTSLDPSDTNALNEVPARSAGTKCRHQAYYQGFRLGE